MAKSHRILADNKAKKRQTAVSKIKKQQKVSESKSSINSIRNGNNQMEQNLPSPINQCYLIDEGGDGVSCCSSFEQDLSVDLSSIENPTATTHSSPSNNSISAGRGGGSAAGGNQNTSQSGQSCQTGQTVDYTSNDQDENQRNYQQLFSPKSNSNEYFQDPKINSVNLKWFNPIFNDNDQTQNENNIIEQKSSSEQNSITIQSLLDTLSILLLILLGLYFNRESNISQKKSIQYQLQEKDSEISHDNDYRNMNPEILSAQSSIQNVQDQMHTGRQDNNSCKIINPIFTSIWKFVFKEKRRLYFQTGFINKRTHRLMTIDSLKSSKKFFFAWMIEIEKRGRSIQLQCYEYFKSEAENRKNENGVNDIEKLQLRLAVEAFDLYIQGEFKECAETYYGVNEKNFKQRKNMEECIQYLDERRKQLGLQLPFDFVEKNSN